MVPVQNVYYLLCYAWGYAEAARLTEVGGLQAERMEDLLASLLASGVSRLLRRGVDRAYLEERDELRAPRGKLDLSATLKRNLEVTGRLVCTYDELRHDVLHNRLLRATMLRLASAGVDRQLSRELTLLAWRMRDVTDIEPKLPLFQRVQLHRNNAHYRFLLHVCELAVRNLVPEQHGTGFRFIDFRADERQMGNLFEEFVRNFLHSEQEHFLVKRDDIPWAAEPLNSGNEHFLPLMKTDISLVATGRRIVIETKFYQHPLVPARQGGSRKLHADHLYQVYAYLKNLEAHGIKRADAAVLLYASNGESFDLRYRVGSHEIQARTLNLGQPWQGIRSDLLKLAKEFQQAGTLRALNESKS